MYRLGPVQCQWMVILSHFLTNNLSNTSDLSASYVSITGVQQSSNTKDRRQKDDQNESCKCHKRTPGRQNKSSARKSHFKFRYLLDRYNRTLTFIYLTLMHVYFLFPMQNSHNTKKNYWNERTI